VFSQSSLEALLFGVCGMLEGPPLDAYQGQLKADWEYLRCKHRLAVQPIPFKFHRMHPGGFPTLRVAQLAMIAVAFRPLCQLLQVGEIRRFYEDDWNNAGYWACRYEFGNTLHGRRSELGKDTRMRLVLNALAPLVLLADGGSWGGVMVGDGAGSTGKVWPDPGTGSGSDGLSHLPGKPVGDLLEFLRWLPPEANKITRQFLPLALKPGNALEAQGLIGIFKTRCNAFRCLECEIGRSAMGSGEGA
ncbi:MAG TPA: DUF2851 family protein, partial [Bacteroidia bacterium]|nr:DUF2851 family protein [Bacteroidia bacterium]